MTKQNDPNLDLDFSAETDDIDAETSLGTEEASLLQAVEVQTEALSQRQRQITAKIQIPHSVEQVWQVLTNYEALTDFIPNLAKSRRLEHPTGGIRLEQVGSQRLLRFNFSARVVLDLEEKFPHEINFNMIEGDFKAFSGTWQLEPLSLSNQKGTKLRYTVRVWPKLIMPVTIIERRLCSDLQFNLLAIRQQIDKLFGTAE